MKTVDIPSKVLLYIGWGTIVVILLTIVISFLSMIFDWIGAPIPMPLLHVANLMFLVNIVLMCMQKKSKVCSVINKIGIALLSPAYIFALYMCVLRILSMDNMLRAIRNTMLTQNYVYLILCALMMLYLFLPITIAIINSIYLINQKNLNYGNN